MITDITQYQHGQTAIMGLGSVNAADLEAAEREVFPLVFDGFQWAEVTTDTPTKGLIADILAPFVWCQFQRNRAQYVKAAGEVTQRATSYGVAATAKVLRVWNAGVQQGRRLVAEHAALLVDDFDKFRFIAELKF
jgi:hypothetical protein